ncbi:MAG: hypothetical protein HZB72_13770 [Burkholderiales bacterium]|nr:hypothetical protein [Burkholderiales bacterium]
MPYVLRNADGLVASLHRDLPPGIAPEQAEQLPADHPEVLAFLGTRAEQQRFASLDAELVRVLEDLIDVLIVRNVIRITDLPPEAQQKLCDRKEFRDRLQQHALKLFGDGSDRVI